MKNRPLPRLDLNPSLHGRLLQLCRLQPGQIWTDPRGQHKIGCLDATCEQQIKEIMGDQQCVLAIHDPPYNLVAFEERRLHDFIAWCEKWVKCTVKHLGKNASFYVWLGAHQDDGFQPLPDFMLMMRHFDELKSRSLITMRNQRGYGTQHNWMAVRQELLYYVKGKPFFQVQYTDIPKILRGYYKEVKGKKTENLERGKSDNIRPGNVWVDIQQVFYRMEENVSGCYAQKPLQSIERIIQSSSEKTDLVVDFFGHSGTTLLGCERLQRRCNTIDADPIYCEIMIRRLERYRKLGLTGWQNSNPFEKELG